MKLLRLFSSWILILSVFFMTGCLSAELPEDTGTGSDRTEESAEIRTSGTPAETSTAEPADHPTEFPTDLPTEPPTAPPTDPPTEPPTEPPTAPPLPEGKSVFFGRLTDENVAAVNRRTLETQGSGLYDVLAPHTWLNEEVLPLIEAYTLPERPFYGARAVTPDLREEILANRNTGVLSEFPGTTVQLRYGIICQNASVRSFPTSLRAVDSLEGRTFDYFQESMFQIGEGVLVLHESQDGEWVFVQGPNYAGWVLEANIGFTSQEEFRSFLTGSVFAVALRPGIAVSAELPSGERLTRSLRLGTVLPAKEIAEDTVSLILPVRNEVGDLETLEVKAENHGAFSDGFLPYSADRLLTVARTALGQPYGWGDEREGYDCSSFVGLTYRCFGFYMPRNSSQFRYAGCSVTDVSGRETSWKYAFLEERPCAVLAYPGHVMLYEKTEGGRHYVLHANTSYYGSDGARNEVNRVTEAELEELHRSDGSLLLDAVQVIVCYP